MASRRSRLLAALAVLLLPAIPLRAGAAAAAPAAELSDEDRIARIEQIMWSRDQNEVPQLRRWAVSDENERVRERSVGALVLLGDRAAGNVYEDRLARDTSPRVRRAAAEAIGAFRLRVPSTLLLNTLQKDPDPMVRAETARAIGLTEQGIVGPALLGAIASDRSPEVRALAAEAYARLKLTSGTELLQGVALREGSLLVRIHVLRALAATAPFESYPTFKTFWETAREPEVRIETLRGLLASERGTWDLEGMASNDDRVRFLALKHWIERRYPKRTAFRPGRRSEEVTRLEPFLQDTVRGIRDLARATLERVGYKTRPSGFGFQIAD